jgi:hypothetical protein
MAIFSGLLAEVSRIILKRSVTHQAKLGKTSEVLSSPATCLTRPLRSQDMLTDVGDASCRPARVVRSDHASASRMLPAVREEGARSTVTRPRHDVGRPRVSEIAHMRMRPVSPNVVDRQEPGAERVSSARPAGNRHRPFGKHHDKPVFHDQSGRRRRWMTLVVSGVGTAAVLLLTTLALALTGNSPVSLPGFPDATRNAGGPHVGVTSTPGEGGGAAPVVAPNATGAAAPGVSSSTTLTPSPTGTPTPGLTSTPPPTVTHSKHPTPSRTR